MEFHENMKIISSEFIGNDYVKDQFREKRPERIELNCKRNGAIEVLLQKWLSASEK